MDWTTSELRTIQPSLWIAHVDAARVVVLANKDPWCLRPSGVAVQICDYRVCPVPDRNRPVHALIAAVRTVTGNARLTGNWIAGLQDSSDLQLVNNIVVTEIHHEPTVDAPVH